MSSPTGIRRPAGIPEALPVAVAITRAADGKVLYANDRLAALAGIAAQDAVGRTLDEVLAAPGVHAAIRAAVGAGRPDGGGREIEVGGRGAAGAPLWLAASSAGVAVDGEPDALLTVFHDVTERRRAEERLAEQAAALKLLAELPEKNPGPVCRLTRDGEILMANEAARTTLASRPASAGPTWPVGPPPRPGVSGPSCWPPSRSSPSGGRTRTGSSGWPTAARSPARRSSWPRAWPCGGWRCPAWRR
jgi:PAS domain S-box-containing protein